MPADYNASRRRDARFARRFAFVLLVLDGLALGLFGALALATSASGPLLGWCSVNGAVALTVSLAWLSGRVIR